MGSTITLGATGSSGLPAKYIVTGPATLNGSQLRITGPGALTITAYQPGDSYWQSSDMAVQSFTVLSSDATLSSLTLSSGTLSPTFNSSTISYTASVGNSISSISVTPTATSANATLQVRINGGTFASLGSGSTSAPMSLNIGLNTVEIKVTAQDGVTALTYTIAMTRIPGYNDWAALHGMTGPNSGAGASYSGDGVANLMKFACGLNPLVASGLGAIQVNGSTLNARGGPGVISVANGSGGTDRYAIFARRMDWQGSGITYTVEFSADLSTWVPSNATPTPVANDGEIEAVTIPFPPLVNGQPPKFFHVKVTGG
jgi:hypothetical protein